jgi:hypothetical protein
MEKTQKTEIQKTEIKPRTITENKTTTEDKIKEEQRVSLLKGIFSSRTNPTISDLTFVASSDLNSGVMDRIYSFALLQTPNVRTKLALSLLENINITSQLADNMRNNENLDPIVRKMAKEILEKRRKHH